MQREPEMRPQALLPLLLVVAACSNEAVDRSENPDGHATRRTSQRIVNGTPDTAAGDSVVFIATGSQGSFCTGTLIAPNLIITARHCVADPSQDTDCGTFGATHAASTFVISVGLQHSTAVAKGSKVTVDTTKPNNICGNDFALIQLDREVSNARLSRVRLTKLVTGEAATTSGYGDDGTGRNTNGRFIRKGIKVDAVGPSPFSYTTQAGQKLPVALPAGEIVTGESTCFGDSGGPLFDAAGNVIGMTSRGIDSECNDRPSIYTDTASHAAVITAAAAAAGHPLQPASPPPDESRKPEATPQADPAGAGDGPTTSNETEDTEESVVPTAKKPRNTGGLGANASSGCSAAPGRSSTSGSSLPLVILAIGAGLVGLRRPRRGER